MLLVNKFHQVSFGGKWHGFGDFLDLMQFQDDGLFSKKNSPPPVDEIGNLVRRI